MQPDHRIVTRLSALVSSLTRYIIKPIPTRFRFLNIILAIALCLASLGGLTPSQSANAATLSVTSTADSGAGTLRQAVLDAAAGDTIKTNLPDPSTIALTSEIIINKDLVIQGQGASSTFLSGGNTNRIFNVTSGTLRLSAVTLQNGRSKGGDGSIPNPGGFNGAGGAVMIASGAGMTATDVNFNNNTAIGGKGGDAIWTGCGACGGGGGGDGGYGGGGGGSRTGNFGGGGGGANVNLRGGTGGFGGGGGGSCEMQAGGLAGSYGGNGGSGDRENGMAAGGGGAGMGGAIFVNAGGGLGLTNVSFTSNSTQGGNGGSAPAGPALTGGGGGGGAGLGSAIFNGGDVCVVGAAPTYSGNTTAGGAAGSGGCGFGPGDCAGPASAGQGFDTSTGIFDQSGGNSCAVWYYKPTDLTFTPVSLDENQPVGTLAGTLSTTDPDAGDTFTYSLVAGAGSTDNALFSIPAVPGNSLVTNAILDYETKPIYSVRIRTTDSHGLYLEKSFTITINNVNEPPTITAIPDQTFSVVPSIGPLAFTIGDPETAAGSLTLSKSSSNTAIIALTDIVFGGAGANRTVTLTRQAHNYGTVTITVTVSDGTLNTSTTFDVDVQDGIPTLDNSIPDQSTGVGVAFSYAFPANTFSDPDGETLTYTAALSSGGALPGWLAFNPATRTFSGTAGLTDRGSSTIRVTASDGYGGTVFDDFVLTVTNMLPVVDNPIPDQSTPAGALFSFSFAANTFSDGDGDTLTYSSDLSSGASLPAWLTFTPATRTFSGTPGNPDRGTNTVRVTADDGHGGSVSTTFNLAVTNYPPIVASPIPDQAAETGVPFSYAVPPATFSDANGDTLSLSATLAGGGPLPGWLSFNTSTNTFSGTPAVADHGTLSIQVTADDGFGGSVSDQFDLVVNSRPQVDNPIPDQSTPANAPFNFTFAANTFSDPDGDPLTYSINGSLPAWLSFTPATRTFSGTPASSDRGTVSIQVVATDDKGLSVSDTFDLTVTNSDPVAGTIPDQSVLAGTAFDFTFAATTFTDPEGDTLTYSAAISGGGAWPAWLTFDAANRRFTGTPLAVDRGTYVIQVTADDGNGGTASTTFNLVVANNPPVVAASIPDQSVNAGAALSYAFPAGTFTDSDGDTLTYTADLSAGGALPAWLSFDGLTRTFSGTPAAADRGTLSVRVTANDGHSGTVSTTFNILVGDNPPTAGIIPDQSFPANTAFSFAFDAATFSDPDGDTLTYSAGLSGGGALPAWISLDSATRTFSGTAPSSARGTLTIQVTADDGHSGTVSTDFDLQITNNAPVAGVIPDQTVPAVVPFSYAFPLATFTDADGDTLTYSANLSGGGALPAWLTFTPATRTFSGTPPAIARGTITLQVTADDGSGGTASTTFDLTVTNNGPVLVNPIPDQTFPPVTPFSYTFPANTFNDPDGDPLTYTATLDTGDPLPAWVTFDPLTRTFSGSALTARTINIMVTADDGLGGTATDVFMLTIANTPGNHSPVVANPIPNQHASVGTAFSFAFAANTFVDYDNDPLTYTATQFGGLPLPAWLSFTPGTRKFTGTPAAADVGLVHITVSATDGKGGGAESSFYIGVDTNVPPSVINPIPIQAAGRGRSWNFVFSSKTFDDADNDPLTYTAAPAGGGALPGWLSFDPATRTFSGTPPDGGQMMYEFQVTADDGHPGHTATTIFYFGPWSYKKNSNLRPGSLVALDDNPGAGPAADPPNATRQDDTADIQTSYDGLPIPDLKGSGISICYNTGPAESLLTGGDLSRLAIGTSHDGAAWKLLTTRRGSPSSQICASAKQFSLFDVFLLPARPHRGGGGGGGGSGDEGAESLGYAEVLKLPATGFAPGITTILPEQPEDRLYSKLGDVWLEIPALGLKTSIVGVPLGDGDWDVSWLWNDVGWLEESAFPGLDGNSVLTGHVYNADGKPGPFKTLGSLVWGNQVIVHAFGEKYTYEVRTVDQQVAADDTRPLGHEDLSWLTLITCHGYDQSDNSYRWRSVVRAVLVKTEAE